MKKTTITVVVIFLLAFGVRTFSVWPHNTIIGFDQARDLFDSAKIIQGDLRIIGPTAGNNPNLHHGVAWLYFMIPPILAGGGNPAWVALWNSLFNAGAVIVIFFLSRSIFKQKTSPIISALLAASSYYFVSYSGWLSNPTVTLLTVPVFFYGVWRYCEGKSWGLPLAMLFLGLSIQFELFFIYLIPVLFILFFILKPKVPTPKTIIYSILALGVSLSTMIATEIKFGFSGISSFASAGNLVGGNQKFDYFKFIAPNLWPDNSSWDLVLGIVIIGFFIYETLKKKDTRRRNLFLLVWLFSPALMLTLGSHNAPWFLIGRPAAAVIMAGYVISKIKLKLLIIAVTISICFINLAAIRADYGQGQTLLEPDAGSILSKQVKVMEYIYERSAGQPFAIDTVTNPLYINAVWAWNYEWYGKTKGYKPNWLGGDQLPPYNTLTIATGEEKYLFLIIDETPRIPPIYTQNATTSMSKKGELVGEKEFDGLKVIMWQKL